MQLDLTGLITEAVERSGVDQGTLADREQLAAVDWQREFPGLTAAQLEKVSRAPEEDTYETLGGSIGSVLSYATGRWNAGLAAVVEDCEYGPMARFMRVVVDILIENPNMFPDLALDLAKLAEIKEAIRL